MYKKMRMKEDDGTERNTDKVGTIEMQIAM